MMDHDYPNTTDTCSGDEPLAPRLRYDSPHDHPPRPMLARLDFDPPRNEEN